MSVQLSAPEETTMQSAEQRTSARKAQDKERGVLEIAKNRAQSPQQSSLSPDSGGRESAGGGRENAGGGGSEGGENLKVVGQGGGKAGKCAELAGLEGVVILRGKDGCIGMTPHQIMYQPAEDRASTRGGAVTSALLKQIHSVDIGAQDEVQVLGAANRLLLSAGPLSSYDVTELSTFFGQVKRRSDALRSSDNLVSSDTPELIRRETISSSNTLTSASSEHPPPPSPPSPLPPHSPPIPPPLTAPARTSGESRSGRKARGGREGEGGGERIGEGRLEGPRALERMEREAGLNARTVLKRVQGEDHLLILTTHALFLFGLQSGLNKLDLETIVGVEREGSHSLLPPPVPVFLPLPLPLPSSPPSSPFPLLLPLPFPVPLPFSPSLASWC